MVRDITGQVFGKWTVLGDPIKTEKGERKWLCRCSCGTKRYVLERSLLSGGSLSCGRECEIAGTLLVTVSRKNCGYTRVHPRNYV